MSENGSALEEVISRALQLSPLDRVRLIERIVPTIESELAALVATADTTTSGEGADFSTETAAATGASATAAPERIRPSEDVVWEPTPPIEVFAGRQGIAPISRFEDLLGDFWPEDERVDDFIAAVRAWRREGR